MSPLLGSLGGSSEYAFRGTLDDWPNDFSTSLGSQNLSGISPTDTPVATLTITGLNYKARVVVENPNITVRVLSEVNTNTGVGTTAVTDGRQTYALRRQSDPALFIRDQSVIQFRLQPTSGTLSDFSKTYIIPVTIGKRSATWTVGVRPIDQTPNTITFNPLIDQELGVGATSNTITVSGLESGFSFPISVFADQVDGVISFYKNSSGPFISSTVVNGDQIYLSTQTPNSYETAKTFTVQVGTFTTSWGVLTRVPDTNVAPFSFIGISSANILSGEYISNEMTVSGSDPGIGLSVRVSGPNAFFEIRDLNNALRYIDPLNPSSTNYWQSGISTAFLTDKIRVKINASANYNTTTVGILTVSNQSGSFIVTTRPTPIDTIPATFAFTNLTNQARGEFVQSSPITLTGMIPGNFGTASIPSSTPAISAQFQVTRGATIVKGYATSGTYQVQSNDIINLRMLTPNSTTGDGITDSFITFRVDGTDTTQNLFGGSGYLITNGSTQNTWNVTTAARSCNVAPFTFTPLNDVSFNTGVTTSFTVTGFNTDCRMSVSVNSLDSPNYNFTAITPSNGTTSTLPSKTLSDVAPGSVITLSVTSAVSPNYLTPVTATVTVTNGSVTPGFSTTANWVVTTVGNTTPASISLTPTGITTEVGKQYTLSWSGINLTGIRSVSWTTTSGVSTLSPTSGSITLTAPPTASPSFINHSITGFANTYAGNYNILPGATIPPTVGSAYTSSSVTVNFTEDTTPIFTPNNFTNQTGVSISGIGVTSNTIVISDISVALSGVVTGSPGASFAEPGSTGIITSKIGTIVSGIGLTLKVNSSPDYLTTTNAYLTITDSLSNIKATKSFSVTTGECFPTISTISYPSTLGANYVVLKYYQGGNYKNAVGANVFNQDFLYGDSVNGGILSFTGNATNYYNAISANSGYFKDYSTTTLPTPSPVIVTWAKLIDIIYYAYTTSLQRPPTISEITTLLDINPPSGYFTASEFFDQIRTDLTQPPIPSITRNTNFAIYNSCPPTSGAGGTAGNSIIVAAGVTYAGIDTGTYPPPPP